MINKKLFLKGLSLAREHSSASDAQSSIYYWWYKYLRLSPVLWYANRTGIKPRNSATANVLKNGGDFFNNNFFDWWEQNCEKLFAEPLGRKELVGLRVNELATHTYDRNSLYVEVPLSIPIDRVMKDFHSILMQHHEGRKLNLATTSQAMWPLHTMRYRLEVIERGYWTLVYKLLYPNLSIWRIGDRLQYAPHLKVRGTEWSSNERRFNSLNSLAGRYLYKGRYTLENAEQGIFPRLKKPDPCCSEFPFGKKNHADFLKLTSTDKDEKSPWITSLDSCLTNELMQIVYKRNFRYFSAKPSADTTEKFLAFYRGETDQLP
jgi:hypothetical protein